MRGERGKRRSRKRRKRRRVGYEEKGKRRRAFSTREYNRGVERPAGAAAVARGGGGGEGRHVQAGGAGEDASILIQQAVENTKHRIFFLLRLLALLVLLLVVHWGWRQESRELGRQGERRPFPAGVMPAQREGGKEDGVGSIGCSYGSGGEEKEEEGKKEWRSVWDEDKAGKTGKERRRRRGKKG